MTSTAQAYEWVKTGHWSLRQFREWFDAQQRTWVGLDPEEIRKTDHHMVDGAYHYSFKQGAEWAEAKLKEKNT